jgi:hypothetical protein
MVWDAMTFGFNKVKPPYDIRLPTFIQVVYERDKVYYFSSRNVISIMIIVQGKAID